MTEESKPKILLTCGTCGKEYGQLRWQFLRRRRRGIEHDFCSSACFGASRVGIEPPNKEDPAVRFDRKIDRQSNSCWLWMGSRTKFGYGLFKGKTKTVLAHRFAYETFVGPVPASLELDHLCRVRHCVNPEHLEPVTGLENARRGLTGINMRSKTHCPKGHEYSDDNTWRAKPDSPQPVHRQCRTCNRERRRKARLGEEANRG